MGLVLNYKLYIDGKCFEIKNIVDSKESVVFTRK